MYKKLYLYVIMYRKQPCIATYVPMHLFKFIIITLFIIIIVEPHMSEYSSEYTTTIANHCCFSYKAFMSI